MYQDYPKNSFKEFFLKANGRFSRETFVIAYTVLLLFAFLGLFVLQKVLDLILPGFLVSIIILIACFYLIYAHFAVCAKRFHDLNLSGWYSLLAFFFPPFLIYLAFKKGSSGENRYGEPFNLDYSGPSFILKACYAILLIYSIISIVFFLGLFMGSFFAGNKIKSISNTGQGIQQMMNMAPKAYKEAVKKPRSVGVLFIDNKYAGAGAPIKPDRIVVFGSNLKKAIQVSLSMKKKVEIRFSDNSSANLTRLLVSNDSASVQLSVFLIDSPIGVPGDLGEKNKKLLDEMNAFQ